MQRTRSWGEGIAWNVSAGAAIGLGAGVLASASLVEAMVVWLAWTAMAAATVCTVALMSETPRGLRESCRDTLAWGTVLSAAVGLLMLSPVAALPGLALLLTSPAVRRGLRTWSRGFLADLRAELGTGSTWHRRLTVTDDLTDADLWRAWRSSEEALRRSSSPEGRLRAAEFRAVLLDELERRAHAPRTDDELA
jgi:hypothetical protein